MKFSVNPELNSSHQKNLIENTGQVFEDPLFHKSQVFLRH